MSNLRLRLFLRSDHARAEEMEEAVRTMCERCVPEAYDLEVLDIVNSQVRKEHTSVLAIPTLERISPDPQIRFTGDLTDPDRIAREMGLQPLSGSQSQ